MSGHKKEPEGLILSALVLIVAAYFVGYHIAYNKAYDSGIQTQKSNEQSDYSNMVKYAQDVIQKNVDLTNQYNQLSTQYNNLRDAVLKYVDATQYKSAPSLHCTSNTFSSTTFTNCN